MTSSIASYRFADGKVYPFKTVGRCLTCQSAHRLEIEQMVARGVPYARIVQDLNLRQGQNRVTAASIANHFNGGHMPVQQETVRRIIERKARERGESISEAIDARVDGETFAEMILQRTVERLGDGEINPGIHDGLAAAKLLAELAPHEDAASESDYVAAFMVYHSVVQEIMTESQFAEFVRRLAVNPVLKVLTEKYADPDAALVAAEDDFYAVDDQPALEGHLVEADDDAPALG